MFKEIIKEMFHPSKAAIISSLKKSDGLPISEVAKQVNMSYMGVKQHCINLEKLGFLENCKVPRKEVGRPEKLYRLTSKCDDLFPMAGADINVELLNSVRELYGEDAPEKLIRNYFTKLGEKLSAKIPARGTIKQKAESLIALREEMGFFNSITHEEDGAIIINEYHNPYARIIEHYPIISDIELEMLEGLLSQKIIKDVSCTQYGQLLTQHIIGKVA